MKERILRLEENVLGATSKIVFHTNEKDIVIDITITDGLYDYDFVPIDRNEVIGLDVEEAIEYLHSTQKQFNEDYNLRSPYWTEE